MSLSVGRTKLLEAHKILQARWERVGQTWDDAQRQQFEKDFLEGLESDLRMAIGAIESMYIKVEQSRSECSDRGGLWS